MSNQGLLIVGLAAGLVASAASDAGAHTPKGDGDPVSVTCGRSPKRLDANIRGSGAAGVLAAGVSEKSTNGLPPEVIQRIVRQSFPAFRSCYEAALGPCPNLQGVVKVRFTIQPKTGRVSSATADSDIAREDVPKCVAAKFKELQFPTFDGPPLKVTYPISFSPGG